MTDSIEQRRKDIREARNKLSQLQICKMKNIYEYTCHTPIPDPTRMADPDRVRGARLYTGTLID